MGTQTDANGRLLPSTQTEGVTGHTSGQVNHHARVGGSEANTADTCILAGLTNVAAFGNGGGILAELVTDCAFGFDGSGAQPQSIPAAASHTASEKRRAITSFDLFAFICRENQWI